MTREGIGRVNQSAADWAAREPLAAWAAILAHPHVDTVPATIVDEHRNMRPSRDLQPADVRALLAWATGVARPDGLTFLADAWARMQRPESRSTRNLPALHRQAGAAVTRLPGFESRPLDRDGTGVLPGFELTSPAVPSWLLSVYDSTGAPTDKRGRGAPWLLRLFVGGLLSVPVEFRTGTARLVPTTTGALAAWLQPAGWSRRPTDFERLCAALRGLDELRVPIAIAGTSGGLLRVVDTVVLPRAFDRGRARVVLRVSIPASAARGARVDWARLTAYGAESAPLYRAYLSVAAVLDYSGRDGRGLTKAIPAAVVDKGGRPRRRKGGAIVRDSTRTVPNPAARFVGWLTDDDVRRMVGLASDHRENRRRARAALDRLAADGVVEVERGTGPNTGRVRLWAPGTRRVEPDPGGAFARKNCDNQ